MTTEVSQALLVPGAGWAGGNVKGRQRCDSVCDCCPEPFMISDEDMSSMEAALQKAEESVNQSTTNLSPFVVAEDGGAPEQVTDLSPYVPTPMEIMPRFIVFVAEAMGVDMVRDTQISRASHVILEVGCGDARLLTGILESPLGFAIHRAVGIEVDAAVLDMARERLGKASKEVRESIELRLQDAMKPEEIQMSTSQLENAATSTIAMVDGFIDSSLNDTNGNRNIKGGRIQWGHATCCVLYITRAGLRRLLPVLYERLLPGIPIITLQFPITGADEWLEKSERFTYEPSAVSSGSDCSEKEWSSFRFFCYRVKRMRPVHLAVETIPGGDYLKLENNSCNLVVNYVVEDKEDGTSDITDQDFIAVYDFCEDDFPDVDAYLDFAFLEEFPANYESNKKPVDSMYKARGKIEMTLELDVERRRLECRYVTGAGLIRAKSKPFWLYADGFILTDKAEVTIEITNPPLPMALEDERRLAQKIAPPFLSPPQPPSRVELPLHATRASSVHGENADK